ncbi:MAG: hypothetical protein RIT43_2392 [Bacteroidota bacterium]|jgi:hypothetical protein
MKKLVLLLAVGLANQMAFGQMTELTDPTPGTEASLYLCDSNAVLYEAVTGSGVVWDYSALLGVDVDGDGVAETRTLGVFDTDPLTADSLFVGATKKYVVNNQITTYYSTSPTERISQGFNFFEPTLGDVLTFWDTVPQILNTYPFDLGSISSGAMSGRIFSNNPSASIDTFAIGTSFSTVDGIGTLKLGTVDYPNTFRYHFVDTVNSYVNIDLGGFILDAPVVLYRNVYEYYNYATSSLPVMVIYSVNNSILNVPNIIVLSREQPQQNIIDDSGLAENMLTGTSIHPNPANDFIEITAPDGSEIYLSDLSGKCISRTQEKSIDISHLERGVYIVTIEFKGKKSTQKVIKL